MRKLLFLCLVLVSYSLSKLTTFHHQFFFVFNNHDEFLTTEKTSAKEEEAEATRIASAEAAKRHMAASAPFVSVDIPYDPATGLNPVPDLITPRETVLQRMQLYGNDSWNSTTNSSSSSLQDDYKLIYFISPTHRRDTQLVDLIRLMQTLAYDPLIYWIVVEDAPNCTARVRNIMERSGLLFAHVAAVTQRPEPIITTENTTTRFRNFNEAKLLKLKEQQLLLLDTKEYKDGMIINTTFYKGRGVDQRNKALDVIFGTNYTATTATQEDNDEYDGRSAAIAGVNLPGFVYFGDDDNAYDVRLFQQIRQTKRIGISGVAFSGGLYERCKVVNVTEQQQEPTSNKIAASATAVIGTYTMWPAGRKFAMDMGGFVFHTSLLQEHKPRFHYQLKGGTLETKFVEEVVDDWHEIEPLDNCEKIYVWHVGTSVKVGPKLYPIMREGVANDTKFKLLELTI